MEVTAYLKRLNMSPRKVRLVVDVIRNKDVIEAQGQLTFLNKRAGKTILKLLNSAIANAENNFNLQKGNLYIKEIRVDEAPILYRWRSRAFGRAAKIRHRSSHLRIILSERIPSQTKKIIKTTHLSKPNVVNELSREAADIPTINVDKNEKKAEQLIEEKEKKFDVRRQGKHRHKQHSDKMNTKKKGGIIKRMFRRKSG